MTEFDNASCDLNNDIKLLECSLTFVKLKIKINLIVG